MRRISKSNVIYTRTNKGSELLFHSAKVAEVNTANKEITLRLTDFNTPTAVKHVNSFLSKVSNASVLIKGGELFLQNKGITAFSGEISFPLED